MWSDWFKTYISKPIFVNEGFEPGFPSLLFQSHFKNGNVDWLGKVNRFTNYRAQEIVNVSFYEFCLRNDIKIPTNYRKTSSKRVNFYDAGFRSAAKYDRYQPIVEAEAWSASFDYMVRHFLPFMCDSRIVDEDYAWEDMNKSSSCGYPWNLVYHNKRDFIESGNTVVSDYWELLASGKSSETHVPIWSSTCKIELRPVEKLKFYGGEYDKLRTFTASPIEHSVNANRMYVDQNNKFYDSAGEHWSFVGATKFFLGFDSAFRRLDRHPNAYCLDESSYDASLFEELMNGCRDFRWLCYRNEFRTPENQIRHVALYRSIIHSVIVLETGELCQKHTGGPSGSSNTIVDNTLNLFRLLAYAYYTLCKEYGREPSYVDFMENVEALLNGDDNTFTVSNSLNPIFNARNIARVWSSIGVVTTPSKDIWDARPLRECDFLSHTWVEYKGHMLPCPETEKVLCSLMYNSDIDDVRWHLLRAYALRIDSWPNLVCRQVISDYIDYLNVVYKSSLYGSVKVSNEEFTMLSIRGVYKNDYELEQLYIGEEGARKIDSPPNSESNLFKNFVNCSYIKQSSSCLIQNNLNSMVSRNNRRNRAARRAAFALSNGVNVPSLPPRGQRRGRAAKMAREVANIVNTENALMRKGNSTFIGPRLANGAISSTGRARRRRRNRQRRAAGLGSRQVRNLGNYNLARYGNAMGPKATDGLSIMRTIHNGSTIEDTFAIRREKVANIIGTTSTDLSIIQALYLNPGNSVLFPIFSQIAATYEQWRANVLYFSYETEAYAASGTNVSAGKVILATNYDPADPQFSTDSQMENYVNSDRGAPFTEIIHDVLGGDHALKDDPLKCYFVNPSANLIAPANDSTNNKFYDMGLFQLGCQGNASSSAEIGELYVTYSFTMIRPKQGVTIGQNVLTAHLRESTNATATATNPLGSSGPVLQSNSNLPVTGTTNSFILPYKGRYLVDLLWRTASANISATPTMSLGSSLTAVNAFADGNQSIIAMSSSTSVVASSSQVIDVASNGTGAGNTVTVGGLTGMTSGTCDIWIVNVPSNLSVVSSEGLALESKVNDLEDKLSRVLKRLEFLQCEYVEEEKALSVASPALSEKSNGDLHRSAKPKYFGF